MKAPHRQNVIEKAPGVVTRVIAGETILVPVSGNVADMQRIFSINEVGAFLWELIDGTASLEELAFAVAGEFDVDEETALSDVLEFARGLLGSGLAAVRS